MNAINLCPKMGKCVSQALLCNIINYIGARHCKTECECPVIQISCELPQDDKNYIAKTAEAANCAVLFIKNIPHDCPDSQYCELTITKTNKE